MFQEVRHTFLKSFQVLVVQVCFRNAAVVFQGAYGCHDDNCVRFQARHTALDVKEFLRAKVCAEACLCDGVISQLQGHLGSGYRVAAVRDVRERSAVYDGRYMLQCLYQVRFQGVFQKGGHSAFRMEVMCGNRFLLGNFSIGVSYDDAAQSCLQVVDIACQTQNCHDLGCYGDVVAVLTGHSVCSSAEAVHYVSQLAVVHIHTSSPGDLSGVDVQLIALEDVVVNHGCQKVVGCSDRVEVACEVQVDVFHGDYLCVAAACSAALNAEYRSQGGLAQSYHNVLAKFLHTVCQTYGCGGLSFSCRSGVDGGNQDQLAVLFVCLFQKVVVDLCLILSVLLQVFVVDTCFSGDLGDRLHYTLLCNLNVAFESHS